MMTATSITNLAPKHRDFARLVVFGRPKKVEPGNAAQAYTAVYSTKGRSAVAGASRLMQRPDVQDAVKFYQVQRDIEAAAEAGEWDEHGDEMRAAVLQMKRDPSIPARVRLEAIKTWLAYWLGKPRQAMDITASAADQWIKELSEELVAIDERIAVDEANGNSAGTVGPISPTPSKSKPRTTAAAEAQAQREASRAAERERRRASRREDSERERRDRMRDETRKLLKHTMGD